VLFAALGSGTSALRRRITALGVTKETRRKVSSLRPHTLSGIARAADGVWAVGDAVYQYNGSRWRANGVQRPMARR